MLKKERTYDDVYSKNGHGTTFKIYLPASEKQVAEEKELPTEVFKLKKRSSALKGELIIPKVPHQVLEKKRRSRVEDQYQEI